MVIEQIELRALRVPMKAPFEASFGRWTHRDTTLVCVRGEGCEGYAESVALPGSFYSEETPESVWGMLLQQAPQFCGSTCFHPMEVLQRWPLGRDNRMAVAALEGAVWDWYSKVKGCSLSQALGGSRKEVEVGISIGIESSLETILQQVRDAVTEGYRRVKVKIKPGLDVGLIRPIRNEWPDLPLMVDANSAYTLADLPILRKLDGFRLLMIEQPLAATDLQGHAALQKELDTPLCLDEAITSLHDAQMALELQSCRVLNLKPGRVGGLTEAVAIHDLCVREKVPVWCGGMFELGVGRSHNIALASLPGFVLPGDLSPPTHTYAEDIVTPPLRMQSSGTLAVPDREGIGVGLNADIVQKYTVQSREITPS